MDVRSRTRPPVAAPGTVASLAAALVDAAGALSDPAGSLLSVSGSTTFVGGTDAALVRLAP